MLLKELGYLLKRKIVLISITAILIDITAIIVMMAVDNKEINKLGFETAKLSIQVLLVVIAGGIFVQEYNRIRSRKIAVNEFRKLVLRNLTKYYSDIKKVRRSLRVKCELIPEKNSQPSEEGIPYTIYDQQMANVSTTQLELEGLVRELKVIKGAFTETDKLVDRIKRMEKYLGKVISEYETKLKGFTGSACIPLSQLPRFNAFMAKSDGSDFSEFSNHYHEALTIIEEERLKVT